MRLSPLLAAGIAVLALATLAILGAPLLLVLVAGALLVSLMVFLPAPWTPAGLIMLGIGMFLPIVAVAQDAVPVAVLQDRDVWDALTAAAVSLIGVVMAVLTWTLRTYAPDVVKAYIDGRRAKLLHEAAATWAETAMTRGLDVANASIGADLEAYARASIPQLLRTLTPSPEVMQALAVRYLAQARARLLPGAAAR